MAARFRILSDFDGVWTDQGVEAEENYRQVVSECVALLGQEVEADLERVRARVLASPATWGWAPDGTRISAYVDEDPLCLPSAICLFLDRVDEPPIQRIRAALRERFKSLAMFSEHCFAAAMTLHRERHPPALVADAQAQLQRVTERDVEVVIVSNSSSDKIVTWLRAAGIDAGEGPDHHVRVRGSAGKQVLGQTDESIVIGGRGIVIDRPMYRRAIEEERPDLVIGDVFSLDLALPHVMRRAGHPAAPRRLALRQHPHTPSWVLGDRAAGAIDHVVDRFSDLSELLED